MIGESSEKLRIRAGLHARHAHRVVEHDVRRRVRRHLNARLDPKPAHGTVLHFDLPAGARRGAATLDGMRPADFATCAPRFANVILMRVLHFAMKRCSLCPLRVWVISLSFF